jgi:hypothetical protein
MALFAGAAAFVGAGGAAAALPGNLSVSPPLPDGRVVAAVVARSGVVAAPRREAAEDAPLWVAGAPGGDPGEPLPWLQAAWVPLAAGQAALVLCGFAGVAVADAAGAIVFRHALSVDPSLPGAAVGVGLLARGRSLSFSFSLMMTGGGAGQSRLLRGACVRRRGRGLSSAPTAGRCWRSPRRRPGASGCCASCAIRTARPSRRWHLTARCVLLFWRGCLQDADGGFRVPQHMASSDDTGLVALWDGVTLTVGGTVRGIGQPVISLVILDARVYVGLAHGLIRVLDFASGTVLADIAAHGRPVAALAVDPRRHLLASVSEDARINVWQLPASATASFRTELAFSALCVPFSG